MKRNKGITLIALVVTIVVLLILAGISISMLGGENGIITKAQEAKEENRGGTVEERRDLWKANQKSDESTNSNTAQTLDELLADLENEGLLTSEEVAIIKNVGVITIGSHIIDFTEGEIDWSKMAPGLYETGTRNMIKSWEELKNNGEITVEGTDLTGISSELEGDLVISNEIVNIGDEHYNLLGSYCGGGFSKITRVYIPSNVKKIMQAAFTGFTNLKEVIIKEGLQEIEWGAFGDCFELVKINIPNSVIKIENSAFGNVRYMGEFKLQTIFIPSSVLEIGDNLCYKNSNIVFYYENLEVPSTWSTNWNLIDYSSNEIYATVKYGYTREQYENEIKNNQ